jgi:hypothetical protein
MQSSNRNTPLIPINLTSFPERNRILTLVKRLFPDASPPWYELDLCAWFGWLGNGSARSARELPTTNCRLATMAAMAGVAMLLRGTKRAGTSAWKSLMA